MIKNYTLEQFLAVYFVIPYLYPYVAGNFARWPRNRFISGKYDNVQFIIEGKTYIKQNDLIKLIED